MKRFVSFVLSCCIISCTLLTVSAESQELEIFNPEYAVSTLADADLLDGYPTKMLDSIVIGIRNAVLNYQETYNLASYNLPVTVTNALSQEVFNRYPEIFNQTDCQHLHYYYKESGIAAFIEFNYLVPKEEFDARKSFYFSEVKRIIATMPEGLSDLEKAVYINEYLTANYVYDGRVYAETEEEKGKEIHDAYGFLYNKTGVCQAYALVFLGFMRELGIECRYASSDTGNHAWNIVKIDGEYYHLDCTHNDPITYEYGDLAGRCYHNHLFVSSDNLLTVDDNQYNNYSDISHDDWVSFPSYYPEVVCDDTRFDNAVWNDIDTPLVYYNGFWYGISNDKELLRISRDFSTNDAIAKMNFAWPYVGFFGGLSLVGNRLYFNSYKGLFSYNIDTNEAVTEATFDTENGIYSSYYNDGKIYCITAAAPNVQPDTEVITYDIGIGDIDQDGTISANDLSIIKKHILGYKTHSNIGLAEVVYDNRINLLDYVRIKKYIVGTSSSLF